MSSEQLTTVGVHIVSNPLGENASFTSFTVIHPMKYYQQCGRAHLYQYISSPHLTCDEACNVTMQAVYTCTAPANMKIEFLHHNLSISFFPYSQLVAGDDQD